MAKTQVIDAKERTRVPFLRGILTRSLQAAGLSFKSAYQMASDVRQQLADVEEISVEDLRKMVVGHLQGHVVEKALERYQAHGEPRSAIYVKNREGVVTPYSNSQLARELEIIGLKLKETQVIVARMYQHLIAQGEQIITNDDLGHLIYRFLREGSDYGPAVADRYLTWINFCRSGKPLVLLIGGTAATGKSTVASALASRLDIVRYQSTDMLREVMRMMIPERLMPVLHKSSFNAGDVLPVESGNDEGKARESRMVAGFRTQADLLSVPCEAVIQRGLAERVSLLLEGVHIQPNLLSHILQGQDAIVVQVMMAVMKEKELKKRIKGRGTKTPQRRSERYLSNFNDICCLQSYLLNEADEYEVPIVVNDEKEKAIREIMKIIVSRLRKCFSSTPDKVFGTDSGND